MCLFTAPLFWTAGYQPFYYSMYKTNDSRLNDGGSPFLKHLLPVRISECGEMWQTPGLLPRAFHLVLGAISSTKGPFWQTAGYMPATQSKPHTILALRSLIMSDQGITHCPLNSTKTILLLNCGNVYPYDSIQSRRKHWKETVNTPAFQTNLCTSSLIMQPLK